HREERRQYWPDPRGLWLWSRTLPRAPHAGAAHRPGWHRLRRGRRAGSIRLPHAVPCDDGAGDRQAGQRALAQPSALPGRRGQRSRPLQRRPQRLSATAPRLDQLVVAVESDDVGRSKAYAHRLAEELRHEPGTFRHVTYRIDPKRFRSRELLYLEP